jgi:hypothetical protein
MKKVTIKYNPYLISTEITVDGQKPKPNSALNVGKKRLQEWVESLPQNLLDEYRDSNIVLEFIGNRSDFDDVKTAFETADNQFSVSYDLKKSMDITDVENEIDKIFEDIQKGPIPELRDKRIVEAFNKAKNAEFEVSVVATMSSGKSTLINALLGKQLMPAANEATTATIVRIIDTEQEFFSAVAYNNNNEVVETIQDVTLQDMKRLNESEKVFTIELKGKIPFVQSVGMKLVLVDTPGPNNARDTRHQEITYQMVADSEKSLVLFVMNGQQLGINDEKVLLDYICDKMKSGGKQGRERFIFAVNKMDAFKPKYEGEDCIERALTNVKKGLESRGIYNPNIFPISAGVALELRTDDDEPRALDFFKRSIQKSKALHFDNYYQFSNLPLPARNRIEDMLKRAAEKEEIEVRSGIVSIEQAVSQYINKYARPTKVYDLVQSFNEKLNELAAVANLENSIREGKIQKAALEKQIVAIKSHIQSAKTAQDRAQIIDNISTTLVEERIKTYISNIRTKLNQMMTGQSNKVEKRIAQQQCKNLENECQSISIQIKVEIDKMFGNTYKETILKVIEEYKRYFSELNLALNTDKLLFNPTNLVLGSLSNLSSILEENTTEVDEGRYVQRTENVFVPSKRKWYNPFSWFEEGDHYEQRHHKEWESRYVDYVDMREVASEFIVPFQANLKETELSAIKHIKQETTRLKTFLKNELTKIDNILIEKVNMLQKTEADTNAKSAEILEKERKLNWLNNIQTRVNNIIHF